MSTEPGTTTTTTGDGGEGGFKNSLKESGKAVVQGPSQGALQAIRAMHKTKGQAKSQSQNQSHQGSGGYSNQHQRQHQSSTTTTANGNSKDGNVALTEGDVVIELKPLSEMKIIGVRAPQMVQGK